MVMKVVFSDYPTMVKAMAKKLNWTVTHEPRKTVLLYDEKGKLLIERRNWSTAYYFLCTEFRKRNYIVPKLNEDKVTYKEIVQMLQNKN